MAEFNFQPGNQLWKLRPFSKGEPRKFEDGEALHAALLEYFQWADENPWEETVVGWYQGDAGEHTVKHPRALTITGFCAHAGLDRQLWAEWRKDREDLKPVIEWADQIMYESKFTGAAAGIFKEGIIARDLGLGDRMELSNPDGNLAPKPTVITFLAPEFPAQPGTVAETGAGPSNGTGNAGGGGNPTAS